MQNSDGARRQELLPVCQADHGAAARTEIPIPKLRLCYYTADTQVEIGPVKYRLYRTIEIRCILRQRQGFGWRVLIQISCGVCGKEKQEERSSFGKKQNQYSRSTD